MSATHGIIRSQVTNLQKGSLNIRIAICKGHCYLLRCIDEIRERLGEVLSCLMEPCLHSTRPDPKFTCSFCMAETLPVEGQHRFTLTVR